MQLCGWENRRTGETKGTIPTNGKALAFSGQQVISPKLLQNMHQKGVFSIIDTYLDLAATGKILGYLDANSVWLDVGKPQELAEGVNLLPLILP